MVDKSDQKFLENEAVWIRLAEGAKMSKKATMELRDVRNLKV